jgi:hypothetical protein
MTREEEIHLLLRGLLISRVNSLASIADELRRGSIEETRVASSVLWEGARAIAVPVPVLKRPQQLVHVAVARRELLPRVGAAGAVHCRSIFPRSRRRTLVVCNPHPDEGWCDPFDQMVWQLEALPEFAAAIEDIDVGWDFVGLAPEQQLVNGTWHDRAMRTSSTPEEVLYACFCLAYRHPNFRLHPEYAAGPGLHLGFPFNRVGESLDAYVRTLREDQVPQALASVHGAIVSPGGVVSTSGMADGLELPWLVEIANDLGDNKHLSGRVPFDADAFDPRVAWNLPYADGLELTFGLSAPERVKALPGALRQRMDPKHDGRYPAYSTLLESPLLDASEPFADVLEGHTWSSATRLALDRSKHLLDVLEKAATLAPTLSISRMSHPEMLRKDELASYLHVSAAGAFTRAWGRALLAPQCPSSLSEERVLTREEAFIPVGLYAAIVARCLGAAGRVAEEAGDSSLLDEIDEERHVQAKGIASLASMRVRRRQEIGLTRSIIRSASLGLLATELDDKEITYLMKLRYAGLAGINAGTTTRSTAYVGSPQHPGFYFGMDRRLG